MQSAYHNLPTINGVMQKDGREFQASELIYKAYRNSVSLGLDIAGAYPPEAAVKSWKRTVTLRRGKDVVIRDRYILKEAKKELQISLMSWRIPGLEADGRIKLDLPEGTKAAGDITVRGSAEDDGLLRTDDGRGNRSRRQTEVPALKPLFIEYDRARFRAAVEPIPLEDAQLRASWGAQIYRILLTVHKTPLNGEFSLRIKE
jgi:hypothetical protein